MVIMDAHPTRRDNKQAIRPENMLEEIHIVRENERRRLSIEIHDGVAQWMIGTLYRIKACRSLLPQSDSDHLRNELSDIERTLQRSVKELRRIIADLRPFPLEELGLITALHQMAAVLEEETINCRFEVDGVLPVLSPAEERATFGIVQEALTNVRKHSKATRVSLRLRFQEQTISVVIKDNGVGFNPKNIADNQLRPSHIGLLGMKDTAALVGAYLKIHSSPGKGTSVKFAFPPASGQTHKRQEIGEGIV
ncbi:MAG: sensor histidine kinase [Dehalococcoidales bacterium]|nr:sensor histidine kinase [Dehalococcoidales bacterium]